MPLRRPPTPLSFQPTDAVEGVTLAGSHIGPPQITRDIWPERVGSRLTVLWTADGTTWQTRVRPHRSPALDGLAQRVVITDLSLSVHGKALGRVRLCPGQRRAHVPRLAGEAGARDVFRIKPERGRT